tara:strand:- start:2058 stop:3149 length:1092 start_codon:yes stop_codon:yes gene_type:complete
MVRTKFHLKDFPDNRIRIKFKDNIQFINQNIQFFGSLKTFANFLGISSQMVLQWKKHNLFIPLTHIKKIVDRRNISWIKLEKCVVAYKNPNSGLIVHKPRLPIEECPEIFSIISHLIADGSVNRNGIPIYTNKSLELIKEFDRLVKKVFGKIQNSIYKTKSGAYQIRTSRVIVDLLCKFYDVNFNSLQARIPSRLFELPSDYICAFLRAYADDEGAVDLNHRITIYSNNVHILEGIKDLLWNHLGLSHTTGVLVKNRKNYYLTIKPKNLMRYQQLIDFKHPLKKQRLAQILRMRKRKRNSTSKTSHQIRKLLKRKDRTSPELALKLGICLSNVHLPLKNLEKKGIIRKANKHDKSPNRTVWRY